MRRWLLVQREFASAITAYAPRKYKHSECVFSTVDERYSRLPKLSAWRPEAKGPFVSTRAIVHNFPVIREVIMSAASNEIWSRDLPPDIAATLDEFRAKSVEAFGDSLKSILLFGSAAEGRLRATSDVNVVMVFSHLDLDRVKTWRPQVEVLVAAIDLQPLFLLEDEIAAAAEAFAVKYFDILHRRRVLHGTDPFATLKISDEALQRRVSQVLLNLALRLRHTLLLGNDAGRTHALVDAIGPLRASAVALQELARQPLSEPREALLSLAAAYGATVLIEQLQALRISGDPVVADSTRLLGELIAFIRAFQPK